MLTRLANQVVPDFDRQVGPPRQNPEIVVRRSRNEGVAVILLVEREHVVAAGERPEECDREAGDGLFTLEFGGAVGFLPAALLAIETAVEHADRAVISQVVSRRHIGQAALEAVVEPHDLVPDALIAVDVERADGLDAIRTARASGKKNNQSGKKCQAGLPHRTDLRHPAFLASSSEQNHRSPLLSSIRVGP